VEPLDTPGTPGEMRQHRPSDEEAIQSQHPAGEDDEYAFAPVDSGPGMVRPGQPAVLYDLATVVGAAYQLDIEPTVRDTIPKRVAAQLRPLLHGMPRVTAETGGDGYLDQLFRAARGLDLLQLTAPHGSERARYYPGPRLETWSTSSEERQLGRFLTWWRSTLTWRDIWPTGWPAAGPGPGIRPIYPDTDTRARTALLAALARCLPGRWYRIDTLLHAMWRRRSADAFERERSWAHLVASPRVDWDNWRRRHAPRYLALLGSSLAESGVISLASSSQAPDDMTPSGVLPASTLPDRVALTTLGAGALASMDATDNLPLEDKAAEERAFVVQPTFEVVALRFVAADIYRLLRVAEIVRIGPTSTFRLTRQALLRGLAAGEHLGELLDFLSHRGKKPLSQNVAYTLKDWARGYHEVRFSEVILLEASGAAAEAALRQTAAELRIDLREIAPGIFAARPTGPRAAFTGALRQRLEAASVVVRANPPTTRQ
jgi:hypothetical protein